MLFLEGSTEMNSKSAFDKNKVLNSVFFQHFYYDLKKVVRIKCLLNLQFSPVIDHTTMMKKWSKNNRDKGKLFDLGKINQICGGYQ